MTEVLVERHSEVPLTTTDIARMGEAGSGCLDIHRVSWNRSLLSADGRELICHFSAADLESVRHVIKSQGPLHGRTFSCTWRDPPGVTNDELAHANVFVSWNFEQPAVLEELRAQGDAGAVCLQNHRVRFLRTFVSSDGRRVICLCLAPDAEAVRLALRDAKRPVERVWAFRQFHP
ncbi:MAG TPA: nickel-binding protein [Polyangiaceae bacterium]|nr:nickel-binding protein [Polyangiaceae bacterium]